MLEKICQQIASKPNPHFFMFKEILFTKNKHGRYLVMIPSTMNQSIVQETHERYGHMGTYKVYQILKQQYKMRNMYRTIKKIIKTCDIFQKSKCDNQVTRGPTHSILPEHPLQLVSLDLMGPLPKTGTERGSIHPRHLGRVLQIHTIISNQKSHHRDNTAQDH